MFHNFKTYEKMETNLILERLDRIEAILSKNAKSILTVDDLIDYTGFKRSYIYKLVHNQQISFYKPNGKVLFFKKSEIDEFLLKNKSQSKAQIENKALDYFFKSKK